MENKKVSLVVIATPNSNESESVNDYIEGVLPQLISAGGKLIKRLMVDQIIHGKPGGFILIMDFDSEQAIKSVFESVYYEAFIPVRNRAFEEINIQIAKNF